MSNHLGRIVLCAALVLASTSAWAKEGWYVGIKGGIGGGADAEILQGLVSQDTDVGPVIMGTMGYAVGSGARMEGEISWRQNDLGDISVAGLSGSVESEGEISNLAFMLNGAYDFELDSPVTPFIMGGIGVSIFELSDVALGSLESLRLENDSEAIFAYQVGAGVSFSLTDVLSASLSYRFFGTTEPDLDFGSTIDINNTHHNGLVGLTYSF